MANYIYPCITNYIQIKSTHLSMYNRMIQKNQVEMTSCKNVRMTEFLQNQLM